MLIFKSGTAVSRGAVLRATNKGNGPDRIAQSSYGFLRLEPYDPEEFAGHKCAKPFTDTVDGERYVRTIVYSMIKVRSLPTRPRKAILMYLT